MRDPHSIYPPPTHARRLRGRAVLGWMLIGLCIVGMFVFFALLPAGL